MKSNLQVALTQSSFYAEWRARSGIVPRLREELQTPPERLLQAIWFHQRLRRDELVTLDGRPVQVLHPGFWNREAGPDFRGAVIQIGADPPGSGDVEVDLRSAGWRAHRHDVNPAFRNVILHVVWEGEGQTTLPTLALNGVLDSPPAELLIWLGTESAQGYPARLMGECCGPLAHLAPAQVAEVLRQAAEVRLHGKAAHLQARARQAGWEQAFWEGLWRGLGYKHNVWPMQRLAELRTRLAPAEAGRDVVALQARLLGVGGLLPDEVKRSPAGAAGYVRRLWDFWWRERAAFADCGLPRSVWRFHGLRPANHPERRLALAAHWLAQGDLVTRVERWCAARPANGDWVATLVETLQAGEDEFWSRHWTLRSGVLARPQPLLGAARATDLAMNLILPWLWVRAAQGKSAGLREEIERRYFTWPAGEDNALLRLARQRLLGTPRRGLFAHAAAQQGLLQIVRDFCEHSDAVCAHCRFPELVRQWPAA